MKSRLLSRRELEQLAAAGSIRGLIAALARTTYRRSVEAALARASGMECIAEALRHDLVNTLGRVRQFYSGSAGEMVRLALRTYDVDNLKAILRGLSQHLPAGEILSALLPVGELSPNTLAELARAPGPRAAIDLLATTRSPFAQPLLRLRSERPGADPMVMELALDRWHFREARERLEDLRNGGQVMAGALDLEIDLANLLIVLRFVESPIPRHLIRQRLAADDLRVLFLGPGRLTFELLEQAATQETLEAGVDILAGTPYEVPLRAGLLAYSQSNRLSEFEAQLRRFRLRRLHEWIVKDPLGMGVVLGFTALKVSEVANIRRVAQGVSLGWRPELIRQALETVS
jgi:vacuolar-type H+-ATPase subunit C/Vma6